MRDDTVSEDESNVYNDYTADPKQILKNIRNSNVNKLTFGHLNINSLRNNFDQLTEMVKGFVDIFLIYESKLDDSFLEGQFIIDGYHAPFRFDRHGNSGGLLLYVLEDIPQNALHSDFLTAERFYAEVILHKKKWRINCSYNPHKNNICTHLEVVTKTLDSYYSKYENVIFLGDFNAGVLETPMTSFCESYNLKSIIKQPTCFDNPDKPSCIDLILTNRPKSFQSTCVIETGLSDFYRMTVTVLKMHFRKLPPKVITYRNFSNYDNANFINSLNDIHNKHENQEHLFNDPDCFYKLCAEVLNRHAPQKKKHVRGNNKPFMNKNLSQAIMQRTKLRNKFLKDPTEYNNISYTKQRNWCVSLLRKEKKEYFANLNKRDIIDDKKPFLSEKLKSREKITLVEKEELVSGESDAAQRFNQFFQILLKILIYTNVW